jgi:hypothetical protein
MREIRRLTANRCRSAVLAQSAIIGCRDVGWCANATLLAFDPAACAARQPPSVAVDINISSPTALAVVVGAWEGFPTMTESQMQDFKSEREKELEERLGTRTLVVALLSGLVFILLLIIAQLAR